MSKVEIKDLIGKTIISIKKGESNDFIEFICKDDSSMFMNRGVKYTMLHYQDCCESVTIEDIIGDLNDLIGTPILQAEERTNSNENPDGISIEYQDSFTWTFYHLATMKGYVTIRWYGASNGYYSESVDILKEENAPFYN